MLGVKPLGPFVPADYKRPAFHSKFEGPDFSFYKQTFILSRYVNISSTHKIIVYTWTIWNKEFQK